ncbi:hypothetical protein AYR66_15430 [Noviherbaspirillum denitrificans]|uniref:UspA domain-containing protein n=1 Tax=Noviherbaspirillum denitrificans TaxID=1968433 RepID=A0A254TLT7_9BURK|nr:hypothetical protein AYR66_15430 [Noviherbaspirillum denitrificans]
MFGTILVPTGGSALSVRAIRAMVRLSTDTGACLSAFSVAEPNSFSPQSAYLHFAPYDNRAEDVAQGAGKNAGGCWQIRPSA